MKTRLYVGNLAYSVTEEELRQEFSQFGKLREVKVIRDQGKSKGFGFVEYDRAEDAEKACDALNGEQLQGRPLKVNEARERN